MGEKKLNNNTAQNKEEADIESIPDFNDDHWAEVVKH